MEIFSQIGFSRYKDHLPMVNAKRTAIFSAILMLGTSGCYQTHLYLEASEQPPEPDAVVRQISTLFATTELEEARALRTVCPGGVSQMEVEQTAADGAFHYLTLGMYSPQTVRVWCQRPR
ncbi:MAG: Bor/Iss family lipoprotein [bacterium]|jgi:hypothetical protein